MNLSVPEEVDAKLTKELLDKYDLKAAGSLVRTHNMLGSRHACRMFLNTALGEQALET